MKPHLIIFAGPNGSGKTTLYKEVLSEKSLKGIEYVNPDEYAIKYGSEVAGAKEALRHRSKLLKERRSFITETTLSGNSALKLMKKAKDAGYKVTLFYICTNNPKLNILSVKHRVSSGGHDVPKDAIVRRHAASIENLPAALKLANVAHVFHRGLTTFRRVFSAINGLVRPRKDIKPPRWVPEKLRTRIAERTRSTGRSR